MYDVVYEERIARLYVQRERGYAQRARARGLAHHMGSFRDVWAHAIETGWQTQVSACDNGISELLAMEPDPAAAERYALRAAAAYWRAAIERHPELFQTARERVGYLRARYRARA